MTGASVRVRTAVALTLTVGLVGLATDQAARAAGWDFPSFGYLYGELLWKAATIAALLCSVRRIDKRRPTLETLGLTRGDARSVVRQRTPKALAALAATVVLGAPLFLIGSSLSRSGSYGGIHHPGFSLIAAEVLVRYPLTVIAEEALFRGWMQPRLRRLGPLLSAALWAIYHLQQWRTIPSLIPIGITLGIIRWWTGDIRATSTLHYLSDVTFFLATYA